MRKVVKGILGYPDATAEEINWAMNIALIDALRKHKQAGNSVVVWDRENDRIVTVPPEEIVVPEEGFDWDGEPIPEQDSI